MTDRSIRLENVSFAYPSAAGGTKTLDDINLQIRDGERVGIVGENGAGKSTLLQIIAGILKPDSGTLVVNGQVHAVLSVGMGIREEATGRENLFLDGLMMGRSRAETQSRLDELIAFAELGEFIDRPVRTYSTGMKARLGFASLVTIEPEILIIDEALGVGDAFFVNKATEAMKRLTSRGAIVILVSHSLASIVQTCDRCLWIDAGRIRADGPASDVTDQYRQVVQAKEAADIARKFGVSGEHWAKAAKFKAIESVTLRGAGDDKARQLFEAGEDIYLEAVIAGVDAAAPCTLRVWAERNDGLIVFDEQVGLPAAPGMLRTRTMRIDLGTIDWRPFLYQFHVECLGPKGPVAHNAATAKIRSEMRVSGGTPVLRDAIQFSVRKL